MKGAVSRSETMGNEAALDCAAFLTDDVSVVVVTGHYGVGKTNFSLNLALDVAERGRMVTLIDLDVVNPYFRSSEYRSELEGRGVRVVAPVFAEKGSSLDVPSLTGCIVPAVHAASPEGSLVIIDAGGDDAGVTALARFSSEIEAKDHRMLYLVNCFRNLTQDPAEALEVLGEIEEKARLKVHAVVGNSHLMDETDASTVVRGWEFASEVSRRAELPLACVTVPQGCVWPPEFDVSQICGNVPHYPVRIYVRTPWDSR